MSDWATFAVENTHTHPRLGEYVHMTADQVARFVLATTGYACRDVDAAMRFAKSINGTPIWLDGRPTAWAVRHHYDRLKHAKVRRIRAL